MTVPELPGFYFDEAKKKYFKIMPNSDAGHAYTQDRVKKVKLAAVAEAQKQEEDLQFKQSLHHRKWTSKTTRTGMRAFRFRSEMGHITNRAEVVEDRNQIWADTLTECKDFRASKDRNISTFEVLPGLDGILTVGEKQFLRWYPRPYEVFYEQPRQTSKMPAPVHRMTSSTLDLTGPRVIVTTGNAYCLVNVEKSCYPTVVKEETLQKAGTMWSCAFSPNGNYAVGGDAKKGTNGILMLSRPEGNTSITLSPHSGIFALEYMENDVLLSGARDGKVRIHDVRESTVAVNKSILRHLSTITHMRKLKNGHHLLVNGLENTVALYDLRFTSSPAQTTTTTKHNHNQKREVTTPVMTYTSKNLSSTSLGFDLSSSQDVFAVAGEDKTVQLYSTYTAKLLRTLQAPEESHTLRFTKSPIDGSEELYVASGPYLQRWRMEHDTVPMEF